MNGSNEIPGGTKTFSHLGSRVSVLVFLLSLSSSLLSPFHAFILDLFASFLLCSACRKRVSDQNKLWVSMVSLVQRFSSRYLVSSFLTAALPCFKEKVSQEETDGNSGTLLPDTWKLDRDGAAVRRSDKREFR